MVHPAKRASSDTRVWNSTRFVGWSKHWSVVRANNHLSGLHSGGNIA
jgi:hypothetical protein